MKLSLTFSKRWGREMMRSLDYCYYCYHPKVKYVSKASGKDTDLCEFFSFPRKIRTHPRRCILPLRHLSSHCDQDFRPFEDNPCCHHLENGTKVIKCFKVQCHFLPLPSSPNWWSLILGLEMFFLLEDEDEEDDVILTDFVPGPALASTTCFQSLCVPGGNFFHLLTRRTHALHISPDLRSIVLKQRSNSGSYFLESVNLDDDDFARQIQHPFMDL